MKPSYGGIPIDQFVAKQKREKQKCIDFTIDYLTVPELSKKMGVHEQTILRKLRAGEIDGVKFCGKWFIPAKQTQAS